MTYGAGVAWALAAAEAVAAEGGAEVEVVDLRTLRPWDRDTVLDSVRRTSRALVVHEAPLTGGFGAEIAAVIGEEAFAWLDAPGRPGGRHGLPPSPSPRRWSGRGRPRVGSSRRCGPCWRSDRSRSGVPS